MPKIAVFKDLVLFRAISIVEIKELFVEEKTLLLLFLLLILRDVSKYLCIFHSQSQIKEQIWSF